MIKGAFKLICGEKISMVLPNFGPSLLKYLPYRQDMSGDTIFAIVLLGIN